MGVGDLAFVSQRESIDKVYGVVQVIVWLRLKMMALMTRATR